MQDYKSLCAAVAVCATMVNIRHTFRHTNSIWSVYHRQRISAALL